MKFGPDAFLFFWDLVSVRSASLVVIVILFMFYHILYSC